MKYRIPLFLIVCLLLVSCQRNTPERVIKDFYYSYQNLDFEKAKTYCAPSMVDKLNLMEANFNQEKKDAIQSEILKNHIKIEDVTYRDDKEHAVAKVVFYTTKDSVFVNDEVTLELRGGDWKVANF